MPFFFLAIVGVGLSSAIQLPGFSGTYLEFMAPGIIGMVLLFASLFSGISVLFDKQFGFLKEILVAPISRTSIVFGKALGGATTALMQALIMLVVSIVIGMTVPSVTGLLIAIAFMSLISLSFVSFGIAFATKMSDPHGFQLIVNFIVMPLFFLSGALFPLEGLPVWLKYISYANPLTYGVDGLRGSLIGASAMHFSLLVDFIVLLVFCILTTAIGSYLFTKSEI